MLRGVDLPLRSMRRDYSALLNQAVDAHNRGLKIEVDLKSYRKKQRTQMDEVRVSWPLFTVDTEALNDLGDRSL